MINEEDWLIQQAQQGNRNALAKLFQQHYSYLMKYLLKLTFNKELAEDLTQATMLKAMEKIKLYDKQRSAFSSWLITIASRLYIDDRRRNKKSIHSIDAQHCSRNLQWQLANQAIDWSMMLDSLHALKEDVRTAIVLKYYYGYSLDEIASILHVPIGTVKSKIFYGLQKLRKELSRDDI